MTERQRVFVEAVLTLAALLVLTWLWTLLVARLVG
jgi:hypothetical protein